METARLIIYNRSENWLGFTPFRYTRFDENGQTISDSYTNLTPELAETLTVKETLTGDAAKSKLWEIDFTDYTTPTDKKAILAVFPDLLDRCKIGLKAPRAIRDIAYKKIKKVFGVVCPRCGGSGSYAQSVAYTKCFEGVCLRCNGSGKIIPRLTDKKLAEIKAYFSTEDNK
jgi:hypothetical protein